MKRLYWGLVLTVATIAAIFYFDPIKRAFHVGDFRYEHSNDITPTVVLDGASLALKSNGLDPGIWILDPVERWGPTNATVLIKQPSFRVKIAARNSINHETITITVTPGNNTNIFLFEIWRPM